MPIPRDYRTVKNPRLTIRDVLIYIKNNFPEGVTSSEITKHFQITPQESSTKLALLKRYGCLRRLYLKKKKPHVYSITRWGQSCAERWEKEARKS